MFSEILKIKPQLDNSDLNKMERTLNARFQRVARRFGRGILSIVKTGGGIGILLGFVNKFLNPLKETQEAIDRLLQSSDDIASNAVAFETTTGKLFKLIQLAKASGLEQDSLFQNLSKFQSEVARVRAEPNSPLAPVLSSYAGDSDMVDAFFSFIQDLKSLDQLDQSLIKRTVFGEDQSIKLNDFIQQDFAKRMQETGLDQIGSEEFTKGIEKAAGLSDLKAALLVQNENRDILKKSQMINESMIREQVKAQQLELDRENQRIRSYKDLQAISQTSERIMTLVEGGVQMIGSFINQLTPKINQLLKYMETLSKSRLVRGVKGIGSWFGGDE